MTTINNKGYLERKTSGGRHCRTIKREWWLGKPAISLNSVTIPRKFWGKRIKFKVETNEFEVVNEDDA